MAQSQLQIPIPLDQATYLKLDEQSETRLELIGGQTVAMAGASDTHNDVSAEIVTAMNIALRGSGCRATPADLRVHVEETGDNFYPDVVVRCKDAEFHPSLPHTLLTPIILVEVLSPSTEKKDRENKLTAYQNIPSLQHYLLVSQDRVLVHQYARADESRWEFRAYHWRREIIEFDLPAFSLAVGDIYYDIAVPEGFTLVPMPPNTEELE